MLRFEDLRFNPCVGHPDNNSLCTIEIEGYSLDIVKKPKTKTYKVKPFDRIDGKKRYVPNLFQEYGEYPEFPGREPLMVFLNNIGKEDLEDEQLNDDIKEDYD